RYGRHAGARRHVDRLRTPGEGLRGRRQGEGARRVARRIQGRPGLHRARESARHPAAGAVRRPERRAQAAPRKPPARESYGRRRRARSRIRADRHFGRRDARSPIEPDAGVSGRARPPARSPQLRRAGFRSARPGGRGLLAAVSRGRRRVHAAATAGEERSADRRARPRLRVRGRADGGERAGLRRHDHRQPVRRRAVTTAFKDLLYSHLPGLYRDKDERGELRRFLEIAAVPLDEIEASIGQIDDDFYLSSCRELFVALIGDVLGADVDRSLPVRAQRAEVEEAVAGYRRKGLQAPLLRYAEQITGWRVVLVDFSQTVALSTFVTGLNPLLAHRRAPVAENPGGSGNFFFSPEQSITPLYDATRGRRIARADLSGHEGEFAGVDGRLDVHEIGLSLFAPTHVPRYSAVAADLTAFATPRAPDGSPLVLGANQVAIDPELGRFKVQGPIPLSGNLTVDFHSMNRTSVSPQIFDLRDSSRMVRLERSDDPAPYTLDL